MDEQSGDLYCLEYCAYNGTFLRACVCMCVLVCIPVSLHQHLFLMINLSGCESGILVLCALYYALCFVLLVFCVLFMLRRELRCSIRSTT
ncbi:hypothetical protein BCR41DRAFT_361457 [Lobosporangium transversale]|uniref:Uncharacterized protein n=1 Tax=Lobosporangium transversale TaxID=64571 RepID=A0A1Y2GCH2_9FUNG|nr:hypothetical protein BCR41DRAFT_361457 [Lobosporangium transversale]ORZ05942.1 hypothetical protein BCR41DRAFT_361457 [Lobosporangium transversale]|eukprot:XP_021877323.1 hypothetical protein BCR41DRAFT_361457 [Lobosporangium transversale]